uniref:Non-specific serine/threonine protein kinase (EC) n=1 Tax=Ganoderma boninense TaxID=34458 RepID=A0A5K1K6G7_9APHY|nr:Non-specific serine/threonine protein kinase (EC [Ganoderma boninense]
MVSDQLCRDWDALAMTIGPTPKLNMAGQVIPLGEPDNTNIPDHKKKFHVVWSGRALGIFYNWGLASAMVTGFSGSSHKSYIGLDNARAAWENGPINYEGTWTPPRSRAPVTTHLALTNPAGVYQDNDDDFVFPDVLGFPTHANPVHLPILPEDYRQLRTENPHIPSSPSSVGNTSILSTPSWMSSGTLSPSTVNSPDLTPILGHLSLGERFTDVDRDSSYTLVSNTGSHPSSTTYANPDAETSTVTPGPVNANSSTRNSQGFRGLLDKDRASKRVKGDPVFVVVRGEYPGVFFDHAIALRAGGRSAGMKVVSFKSLKVACLYFVQQYMAGNVGLPVFVVADEEEM